MPNLELSITGELPEGTEASKVESVLTRIIGDCGDPDTLYRISLALVDTNEMVAINRNHRGVNSTTDVLSFLGDRLPIKAGTTIDYLRLCDIVIDTNQVFRQKGANSYTEEFWRVLIHGALHIAGFDHIQTPDKKKMEDAEENYRNLCLEGLICGQ